jgi:aspartate ammonia-lyase
MVIVDGRHHSQFVVDAVQGSAGISTNLNAIVVRWLEGRG